MKGWTLSLTLVFASVEAAVTNPDPDFIRYALTQGGLLAVVLVLLWSYRRDFQRQLTEQAQTITVLTSLVSANTQAMEQLSGLIERFTGEDRRQHPRH